MADEGADVNLARQQHLDNRGEMVTGQRNWVR